MQVAPYQLEKREWTDIDFPVMGWHDARLYGITLPTEDFWFEIEINYIFEWVKQNDVFVGFQVAACRMRFFNPYRLRIAVDYEDTLTIDIKELRRTRTRPSPNGKMTISDFCIDLGDQGSISFEATGFLMSVISEVTFSRRQDIGRSDSSQ